ncbi:mRNA-degrading endonuclease toxin of MazEF toxin-antitoxin module [Streptosporangium album]|uniref:mRNA-degrading endonuclease toxin of MazEF toxin-antitoxin module n=1 Tax=Streptosporangium album TaxID=47479 RepID=A0A7W7RZG9_9ACTN|nr:type II toxin-antitoxin system PemK/MazF family toxin [Streptosporangium album]MBB4940777.1 mRNA-degrading endonuclease toxin of MazEF toxin-antitoxin module [Streptosporangium album]
MKAPIRKGGVYWVDDSDLTLPPNDERNVKPRRPVIVVSGDETNENPDWPIALVVPISTAPSHKTAYCLQIGAAVANLPKKGWARIVAVQPLAKDEIQDLIGHLPADMQGILHENLFAYMGLVD